MAEKVDQDVREAAYYWMVNGEWDEAAVAQAFARMKAAGREQGLREAAEVARSLKTCGCEGKHGYCSADSPLNAAATAIEALLSEKPA